VVDVAAPSGVAGRTSAPSVSSRVVLDTSVLISDPEAVFAFPTSAAVIPLTVVEELDSLKTRPDDVGRSAREVLRRIEVLRVENGGDIRSAVALPGGGTLQIETNGLLVDTLVAQGLDPAKADNRILAAALGQAHREVEPVELVSNDAALRIKAAQVGLVAREHHRGRSHPDARRATGWSTAEVSAGLIDDLYGRDAPHLGDLGPGDETACAAIGPNEYAVLRAGQQSVLVKRRQDRLAPLPRGQEAWGLRARAKEQQFALTSSSIPMSASWPSTATPAPARRSSPSPPGSSR
jgi:PhoH-like ATPase